MLGKETETKLRELLELAKNEQNAQKLVELVTEALAIYDSNHRSKANGNAPDFSSSSARTPDVKGAQRE